MHRLKGQDVPSGGRLAGEQPGRSRGAVLSRSGRSTEITRRPLPPLGADCFARATSRQSTSKLSMIDIVGPAMNVRAQLLPAAREKRENWRASAPENAEPASPPSCPGEDFYHHARDRPQRHWKKPPRDQPPSPRAQRIASFISRKASAASLPPAALVRSQYHIPSKLQTQIE